MTTNVIDAFVMTLGLDPSGFKKGKAEADAAILSTKNLASGSAAEIGGAVKLMALEFAGLFLAVRSISDVVHFFTELNHEIADLGYTSRQLGETAANLRLYQQVGEGFGGTAAGVNSTVESLESALFNMRQMGQFSDTLIAWQRFGGGLPAVNAQGGIDYLKMVQQVRGAMHGLGDVEANQRMMAMGLDPGTRNAVLSSTADFNKWVEAQRKSAAEFAQNTAGAQRLSRSWVQLKNDTQGLAATLLSDATPALQDLFKRLDGWFKSDGPEHFRQGIDKVIGTVEHLLGLVDELQKKGIVDTAVDEGAKLIKNGFKSGVQSSRDDPLRRVWSIGKRATLAPLLAETEKKYGLPKGLLDGVITQESNYDAQAKNGTHVGLMQLNSKDTQNFPNAGLNYKNDVQMGAAYLASLHKMFGGDKGDPDWIKAVAAFNAGPGTERDVLKGQRDFLPETLNYVPRVLGPNAHAPAKGSEPNIKLEIGSITIHSQATDATGIADDLYTSINRRFNVFQSDAAVV